MGRPPGFPFALNSAVKTLLEKEFDRHRNEGTIHTLIGQYNVDARPAQHKDLNIWRDNFKGVQYLNRGTNLLIFGAIGDLWQNSNGDYIVVDYKATAKGENITELNKDWQIGYKRQMEIYQWLIRKNGYKVSDTGYFVYCNGKTDKEALNGKLEFDITLIPYTGDDSWIESVICQIHTCLHDDNIPNSSEGCDYCRYISAVNSKVDTLL